MFSSGPKSRHRRLGAGAAVRFGSGPLPMTRLSQRPSSAGVVAYQPVGMFGHRCDHMRVAAWMLRCCCDHVGLVVSCQPQQRRMAAVGVSGDGQPYLPAFVAGERRQEVAVA